MSRILTPLGCCARFAVARRVPRRGSFSVRSGGVASLLPEGSE